MTELPDDLATRYLELLGADVARGAVDADALHALQRAHLGRFPYETLDIVRGLPPGIDPVASAERLVGGRGGYCYHLNGAFSALLEWLGVDVKRHRAGVQPRTAPEPQGADGNHLALTVRTGDAEWLVDVGLGDGPVEPLPLMAGAHVVDGLRFVLRASSTDPGGWRVEHDVSGSFTGFDVAPSVVEMSSFEEMHRVLSTRSGFARLVTVQRRIGDRLEVLRGCVLTERTPDGASTHDVTDPAEWWALVLDRFGLAYAALTSEERDTLWRHVQETHEAWDAAGRP